MLQNILTAVSEMLAKFGEFDAAGIIKIITEFLAKLGC